MNSLNLLDGTAPLPRERTAGLSKRFIIGTGVIGGGLLVAAFFLEVIFAAFGFGGGSLFTSQQNTVIVSQDEFDVINRERAAAAVVFGEIISFTPAKAHFSFMKLSGAKKMYAQGWISSQEDADRMFAAMRSAEPWDVKFTNMFDKPDKDKKMYKFNFSADFYPQLDEQQKFTNISQFPSLDSLNAIVSRVTQIAKHEKVRFVEKPVIAANHIGESLHEYIYTMKTESRYGGFHNFLNTVYAEKLPVIFDDITLRPERGAIKADIRMRVLIH